MGAYSTIFYKTITILLVLHFSRSIQAQIDCNNETKLNLSRKQLTNISFTQNCNNLKELNLSFNQIEDLPLETFSGLPKLKILDLSSNNLKKFENFQIATLKVLKLDDNSIETLGVDGLRFLEELSCARNKISDITWIPSCELKKMDFSRNKIEDTRAFGNCVNLEEINLSYNNISDLEDNNELKPENLVYLRKIDLSFNKIQHLPSNFLHFISNQKVELNLQNNEISSVAVSLLEIYAKFNINNSYKRTTVHLDNNPLDCELCEAFGLTKYFHNKFLKKVYEIVEIKPDNLLCSTPENLKGQPFISLKPEVFNCSINVEECPKGCECLKRPFDNSLIVECSSRELEEYPEFQLIHEYFAEREWKNFEVVLSGNKLTRGPLKGLGLKNVTKLDLSRNNLREISWVPQNIQVLDLSGNKLENISFEVLEIINKSEKFQLLSLHENPWNCGCEIVNLTEFLREHAKQVHNPDGIKCADNSTTLIKLTEYTACGSYQIVILSTIMTIVILALILAAFYAAYYKYGYEIKVWLFSRGLCLNWLLVDEDLNKQFDAFITYEEKDEDFVLSKLVTVLENNSNSYKVCTTFRNGLVGEERVDQVIRMVEDSRRTIVVLSNNFLADVWSHHEFRTAHLKAMMDDKVKVIVVIYGDVNLEGLDEELDAYLKTNTYLEWGDPWFWKKLRYSLPHPKPMGRSSSDKISVRMEEIEKIEKLEDRNVNEEISGNGNLLISGR